MNASLLLTKEEFPEGLAGLVFDVDGVMFDSRHANVRYYNMIRRALELPDLDADQEAFCQMASAMDSLRHIIPEARLDEALAACRNISYARHILPMLTLEPGLAAMLRRFKAAGLRLAVCTNRMNTVDALFARFGLEDMFHPVKTAENSPAKPSPAGLAAIAVEWNIAPGRAAFLGDSLVDAQAAAGAGMPFWAFRNPELPAMRHVPDFSALERMVQPLL